MKLVTWILMLIMVGGLMGCASNGTNDTMMRGSTDGSMRATQSSAGTIAPITSYINNMHR